MVPEPGKSSLGLEYFCNEGDELWTMTDRDLVELGKAEVERIGLARAEEVEDGCVVRVPKAYPIYDSGYSEHLAVLRQFVDGLDNVQTIGRNGLHRYNNQDHAMLTGMLAVRNATLGERNDLWSVNADEEYHEEIRQAEAPEASDADEAVSEVFTRIDGMALGLAAGITSGVLLLLATIALVVKGGGGAGLDLLGQYFPGYSVSLRGSILGLVYGFGGRICRRLGVRVRQECGRVRLHGRDPPPR